MDRDNLNRQVQASVVSVQFIKCDICSKSNIESVLKSGIVSVLKSNEVSVQHKHSIGLKQMTSVVIKYSISDQFKCGNRCDSSVATVIIKV